MTKITIEASVSALPSRAWDYWTHPEHMTQWNFASPDWHCPSASNDLRVGGKLKSRMEAKDGSFGFDFEGTYQEIIDGRKIVYSLDDGRQVETVFENVDGQTRITTSFDAENTHPVEMQRDGWQAILNNFKSYVER